MEIFVIEDIDPLIPKMGGVAGFSRKLIHYLANNHVKVTLLGVCNNRVAAGSENFCFLPIIRKSKYTGYEYLCRLMLKSPFLHLPKSSIIHSQHPGFMLPFALFHPDIPKIVTIHGQVLSKIKFKRNRAVGFIYKRIESFVLKRTNIVMVVDDITRNFYQTEYPWLPAPVLLPTGIDLEKFKPLERDEMRTKWGFRPGDKVVVYVGRLEKEKGPDILFECYEMLVKKVPEVVIVYVGDGKEKKELEQKTRDSNIKRIIFMGAQPPDVIPEILSCADVLALCSYYEGSPTVVKEALACGIPVVSTDVGDVRQVLENKKVGKIVPRTKKDFADALTGFLLDPDKELTRSRCASTGTLYSFDQVGIKTVEIYRKLSGENIISGVSR